MNTSFSTASDGKSVFYTVDSAPANSVLLVRSQEEARRFPSGSIELAYCPETGFITNQAFAADLVQYNAEYEETQGFSDTFTAFHERLAEDLIARYNLRGKRILEIGCGKGEFLTLLCDRGGNEGVGFDPVYRPERNPHPASDDITFIRDFYSEEYAGYEADFVCCKMTLEHIPDVADFVGMVRRTLGANPETIVFFQVPDVRRILRDRAFWDVYHEHCSYFSAGSLARLFRSQGFDVASVWTAFDDQYLMIEASPGSGTPGDGPLPEEEALEDLEQEVRDFSAAVSERISGWKSLLNECYRSDLHVALWGGGSKAVAFLTTLGIGPEVCTVVDINPYKQGAFLPGTGHRVSAPEELMSAPPDVVIVMNPIYDAEIAADLDALRLRPTRWAVDADPKQLTVPGEAVT